jgi:hypothetical protein
MHVRAPLALFAAAAAITLAACQSSSNEVQLSDEGMRDGTAARDGITADITSVAVGKSLNQDHTIKDTARTFDSKDTIYASIKITGRANSGLVRALWLGPDDQPVQNDFRLVIPSRNDIVDFKVQKPEGLKPGDYRLEVFLDDRHADSHAFVVKERRHQIAGPIDTIRLRTYIEASPRKREGSSFQCGPFLYFSSAVTPTRRIFTSPRSSTPASQRPSRRHKPKHSAC